MVGVVALDRRADAVERRRPHHPVAGEGTRLADDCFRRVSDGAIRRINEYSCPRIGGSDARHPPPLVARRDVCATREKGFNMTTPRRRTGASNRCGGELTPQKRKEVSKCDKKAQTEASLRR